MQNENVLRKKYQQELSIQLNKIKTIFQTIPALAVIVDLELNILDLNIQFVQTFTVSDRSNLVGSALKKNILPEHFSFLEKNIQSSIESDDLVENIFHTQSIQGNQNSFKIFFRPVLDSSKTTYAVLIVYVDITDIHQITQKLADSESKYRLLAEKMDDVIWVFNSKTFKYEYVSPSIKKLRGFEVEEVMNQNISESLIVEDFQKVYDKIIAIQTDIKAGKPMEESLRFEFEQMCKNGERKWVEISINIVLDENNDIHRLIGVSRDLSERKKAQIQLENYAKELKGLNATKDKLFSIIAHDLKNPFNTILGFSDIMIDSFESFDNEQKLKFVNHIYTSAQSGYNLLENLLTWSRSQIGNLKSNPVVLDINLIINERIIELNSAAIKKGIYLHMNENDLRNKQIFADEEMINSILRNLISNAIKFSNTDQEILVEANSEIIEGTEYIVVKVMDQGVGIHYELQPNIFNFDPDKSKKGTQGERGTGLGLMICKEFIEINHGTISVESKLGKGSTFFVRIPAYLSDSAI